MTGKYLGWVLFTDGYFINEETKEHRNVLQLEAVLFGLSSLARDLYLTHIKILCDNSAAVACISKSRSIHSVKCNVVSRFGNGFRKRTIGFLAHTFQENNYQGRFRVM